MNGLQLLPNIITLAESATDLADKSKILAFDQQLLNEVIFHGGTVLLLIFILAKLLFNPVRNMLEKRRLEISEEYKTIENNKNEALTLKAKYEEKIANIEQEKTDILEKARKLALHQENKMLKAAKAEADEIKEIAYIEVEREKAAAKDDIRKEIIEVATLMANKFVKASIDDATKAALLENTLNEMGESTWLN